MTKLNWIVTLLMLLLIGLIVAVPWVRVAEHSEHYIDEYGRHCYYREYKDGMKITGCYGFSSLHGIEVKNTCLEKMEAAMRAVDGPFITERFHLQKPGTYKAPDVTMTQDDIDYANEAFQLWQEVKRECWKGKD